MNKLYSLILFIAITLSANAQESKNTPASYTDIAKTKVLKFYPNPAIDIINFEFLKPVQKDLTLQVYNFIGKKIFELNGVSQKTSVTLSEFYRGLYIFQLRDKSGRIVESGKFQVNK